LPVSQEFLPVAFRIFKNKAGVQLKWKSEINKVLKLQHRELESFFTSLMQDQLKESEAEVQKTYEEFKNYSDNFYKTCTEYTQEWCLPFLGPLQSVDSISLKKVPDWYSI
jgi:uncharacterized protein YwgA